MTSNARQHSFRGVVQRIERHGIRIADEFQGFILAQADPKLKLKSEDVVQVIRVNNHYQVQCLLPYQLVQSVRHPQVPGLRGRPIADIGDANIFSALGQTYAEQTGLVTEKVESWIFENREAEAAYLHSLILGASELPGVQFSEEVCQRLSELGIETQIMARAASEFRRVQAVRTALEKESEKISKTQAEIRANVDGLTQQKLELEVHLDGLNGQIAAKAGELDVLLQGITDAEEQRASVQAELDNFKSSLDQQRKALEKERREIIKEARHEAKTLKDSARDLKATAEAEAQQLTADARRERSDALEEIKEIKALAVKLHKNLGLQTDSSDTRAETYKNRTPFGGDDEAAALDEALKNLKDARDTDPEQLVALHVGLKHTPFTVLAGPSGSGKTSLVLAYAQQMGIHVTTVAVQPGWRSVQDLHGYVNPLRQGEYRSTPFFEALGYQVRQSQAEKLRRDLQGKVADDLLNEPAHLPLDLVLLDEINLSQVEYFLADYLSAFELDSRTVALTTPDEARRLALQDGGEPDDTHPLAWLRLLKGQMDVPSSFLIAGTANEDHTTLSFSDKFRDRAAFLRVEAPTLESVLKPKTREIPAGKHYISQQTWQSWCSSTAAVDMTALIEFSKDLQKANLPVSVRLFQRTARMSSDAKRLLDGLGVAQSGKVALDLAVSLGIAHKYGQLTEGRSAEERRRREALRNALEKLLSGRTQATFATLGE